MIRLGRLGRVGLGGPAPSEARASGLGSTTVTRCPAAASGTARPPVPPPRSRTRSGRPSSVVRRWTTASTDAHTAAVRSPVSTPGRRVRWRSSVTAPTLVPRASGAGVPQLARGMPWADPGRPGVGIRGLAEPGGVDEDPASRSAAAPPRPPPEPARRPRRARPRTAVRPPVTQASQSRGAAPRHRSRATRRPAPPCAGPPPGRGPARSGTPSRHTDPGHPRRR